MSLTLMASPIQRTPLVASKSFSQDAQRIPQTNLIVTTLFFRFCYNVFYQKGIKDDFKLKDLSENLEQLNKDDSQGMLRPGYLIDNL